MGSVWGNTRRSAFVQSGGQRTMISHGGTLGQLGDKYVTGITPGYRVVHVFYQDALYGSIPERYRSRKTTEDPSSTTTSVCGKIPTPPSDSVRVASTGISTSTPRGT